VTIDANRLLVFCRAVEVTSDAGLMLFDESDILETLAKLETLKEEVERAMFRLASLTKTTTH
jgi:hypothetical protein